MQMIFDSGQSYSGRAYRDAIAAAHSHGVPIILARRGMRWTSGDGVTLDVLAPSMPFLADTGDDVNENSIVVMLRYGGFRELFMVTPVRRVKHGYSRAAMTSTQSLSRSATMAHAMLRRPRSLPPFTLGSR